MVVLTPTEFGLLGTLVGGGGVALGSIIVSAVKSRFLVRKDICELKHQGLSDILNKIEEDNRIAHTEIKAKLETLNGRG